MANEELTIRGRRYDGLFQASVKTTPRTVGSEYNQHDEDFNYWEGQGMITDSETGRTQRFTFTTPEREVRRFRLGSLEGEMIRVKRTTGHFESIQDPEIIEKELVNDLVLGQMYEDSLKKGKESIIPRVYAADLSYEDLVSKAFIAETIAG